MIAKDAKLVEDSNLKLGSEEWLIRRHLGQTANHIFRDNSLTMIC